MIPLLKLNQTEIFEFFALAAWNSFFYWDNSDLNTTNQNYVVNGNYLMTERWTISGGASYLKDTTLNLNWKKPVLSAFARKERELMRLPELTYAVSERSSLGFDYDYRKINYEREFSVDNELNSFRLIYNRRVK